MSRFVGLVSVSIALSGCYFFYPTNVPSVPGPAVVEGAQIEVATEKEEHFSSCNDTELKADLCELHGGEWKKPYYEYIARATYGGHKLTQGEFYMLTDPSYVALVNDVSSKKGTCNISLVPSAIALAGAFFALVTLAGGDNISKNTDTQLLLYGIGAGTFLAGSALSYPLGGYACRSAGKLGDSVEMNDSAADFFSWLDHPEKVEHIQQLAEAFNAKHAAGVPREAPPADSNDATTPHEAAPATEGSVLSALQSGANFKTFLRILDKADGAKQLDKDGPVTVFAPTDDAFAKLSPDLVTGLETDKNDATSFLQGHIAKGAHPLTEMKRKHMSVHTVYGGDISLKQDRGIVHVDRGALVGEPVTATNGVLYAVDTAE